MILVLPPMRTAGHRRPLSIESDVQAKVNVVTICKMLVKVGYTLICVIEYLWFGKDLRY
jgi:hypothetical protein